MTFVLNQCCRTQINSTWLAASFFLNAGFSNSESVEVPGWLLGLLLYSDRPCWRGISNLIFCVFFFPPSGLPDGLPDAVCPAAMLQHVLRAPQQQWETNATVYWPLAGHLPLQHIHTSSFNTLSSVAPSLLPWWIDNVANKMGEKNGMMGMAEERKRHALTNNPMFLYTCDGMMDLLGKRMKPTWSCSWRLRALTI